MTRSRIAHIPVRWSWLKAFASSAAHALWAAEHGKDPTPAMKMGTAGHAATFEPHRIRLFRAGSYVDAKGKTRAHTDHRRGKAYDLFVMGQPADSVIVNARELAHVTAIAEALRRADEERVHPDTGEPLPLLFGPGVVHERRILWERNGRSCSSTPDARLPGVHVTDLKLARTGDPARYPRDAGRQGYPSQLVMYDEADAYERTGDYRNGSCELYSVVVEPYPPYVVTTYRLDASAVESGARSIASWWEQLRACEEIDHWPGYVQSVADFTVDDPLALVDGLEVDSAVSDDDVKQADDSDDETINWDDAA